MFKREFLIVILFLAIVSVIIIKDIRIRNIAKCKKNIELIEDVKKQYLILYPDTNLNFVLGGNESIARSTLRVFFEDEKFPVEPQSGKASSYLINSFSEKCICLVHDH